MKVKATMVLRLGEKVNRTYRSTPSAKELRGVRCCGARLRCISHCQKNSMRIKSAASLSLKAIRSSISIF